MILALVLKFNPSQHSEIQNFLAVKQPALEAEPVAVDWTSKLELPLRATFTIQRVVRDSVVGKNLKRRYQYECQVCGQTIELPNGKRYAEVHHLRPVGKPHNGKDGFPNTIVVCPQHHAMFDLGAIAIEPQSYLIKNGNKDNGQKPLKLILSHDLDPACIEYHNRKIFNR
jgi:predicted restriction endonuclease